MTRVDRLYAYRQSHQLTMQSGAIGYLRGDFAKNGAEFHSRFFDLVESRKTDAFRADIDNVVNTMREPGRPLRDRYTMLTFCGLREQAGFEGNIGKEYGFRVETAENGQEAVNLVRASSPGYYDAILMDIQMPVMDGYEATRAIRGLEDRALADIPILAMTANAFKEDIEASEEAGMQAHIAKPIDVGAMLNTLRNVLGGAGD